MTYKSIHSDALDLPIDTRKQMQPVEMNGEPLLLVRLVDEEKTEVTSTLNSSIGSIDFGRSNIKQFDSIVFPPTKEGVEACDGLVSLFMDVARELEGQRIDLMEDE